jgi:hypothetical protein
MGASNDYTKEEDYMMWELHEIRKKMAKKKLSVKEINRRGKRIATKYGIPVVRLSVREPQKDYNH